MAKKTAAKSTAAKPAHAGFIIEGLFSLTKMPDRQLVQINELVDSDMKLAGGN
jgi:hypothetical protein